MSELPCANCGAYYWDHCGVHLIPCCPPGCSPYESPRFEPSPELGNWDYPLGGRVVEIIHDPHGRVR